MKYELFLWNLNSMKIFYKVQLLRKTPIHLNKGGGSKKD